MEKRLFIAIFVSIAFLWAWGAIAPKLFPGLAPKPAPTRTEPERDSAAPRQLAEQPRAVDQTAEPAAAAPIVESEAPLVVSDPVGASSEEQVVFDSALITATFSNRGGVLSSLILKEYAEQGTDRAVELVRDRSSGQLAPFTIRSGSQAFNEFASEALYRVERTRDANAETIRFTAADGQGRAVTKSFVFDPETYAFRYEVSTRGLAEPFRMVIGPGVGRLGAEQDDRLEMSGNLVVQTGDDYEMIKRKKIDSFMTIENPRFVGLADHYFLTVLLPEKSGAATVRPEEFATSAGEGETLRELWVGVNAIDGSVTGTAYFGPKKAEILEQYGLEETLELGIFGMIARFLLTALLWVNSYTQNFGWAIVLLTVLIKLVLYPLQHKSIVSMKRMQKVQPKMNAIRDKYRKAKTDPQQKQKMNLEMMELYKREGINPMSGCLPILLQLPILWAFYILLSNAIELRGEPFILWITDLSQKDPYYITPILMTVTMFIQQWITPTAADPMQRKIFLMMPIIFGYIFKEFPSGLVLYWLVQNLLTILQQSLMNYWWKEHPESLEKGATT